MGLNKESTFYVHFINPFMPNVISFSYQLDESISNFRVNCWVVLLIFFQILKETSISKQWRT